MDTDEFFWTAFLFIILGVIILGGLVVAPFWSLVILGVIGWIIYKVKTTPKE